MRKPTIVQFIADNRSAGKTDSEITHMLLDAGWHMDIIHKTINGEPIRHRHLEPILNIKKQPLRKHRVALITILILVLLGLIAAFI